jgi:riboflavin kinase/FMN adenylyltransferase
MIIALGLFDGLHIGHRKVISFADTVYTFNINTVKFKRNEPLEFIYSEDFKKRIIKNMGITHVISEKFDAIKDLSPTDFVDELKKINGEFGAICGEGYKCGENAIICGEDIGEKFDAIKDLNPVEFVHELKNINGEFGAICGEGYRCGGNATTCGKDISEKFDAICGEGYKHGENATTCGKDIGENIDENGENINDINATENPIGLTVVCGADYRFGKGAKGDVELLSKLAGTIIVPPEKIGGIVVSSTEIKKFLMSGDIKSANLFLGEPYTVSGEVMHGRQFGRIINFPTVNQYFMPNQIVPKYGVYKSHTLGHKSITNIGVRPTFDLGSIPVAETHILDFDEDLYGKVIDVHLTDFIREEKKFAGIDELKNCIANDVEMVLRVVSG